MGLLWPFIGLVRGNIIEQTHAGSVTASIQKRKFTTFLLLYMQPLPLRCTVLPRQMRGSRCVTDGCCFHSTAISHLCNNYCQNSSNILHLREIWSAFQWIATFRF